MGQPHSERPFHQEEYAGGKVRKYVLDGKSDDEAHHPEAGNEARDIKAGICQREDEHDDPEKDPNCLLDEDLQGSVVLDSIEETRDMFVCYSNDEVARDDDDRDDEPRKVLSPNLVRDIR